MFQDDIRYPWTKQGVSGFRYNLTMGKNRGQLKTLVTYSLCLAMAAPGLVRRQRAAAGIYVRKRRHRARMGGQIPRHTGSGRPPRLHGAPRRPAASRGVALRQGQRGMDRRQGEGVGARRADRNLRRPLPYPEGTRARNDRAGARRSQDRRACRTRRRHLRAAQRAIARLQRLLHRRRCHRAPGLRELRHPGRLRRVRPPRHLRKGRDRDRPLRRQLARHQAQSGRRARRSRMPDLFRPAR